MRAWVHGKDELVEGCRRPVQSSVAAWCGCAAEAPGAAVLHDARGAAPAARAHAQCAGRPARGMPRRSRWRRLPYQWGCGAAAEEVGRRRLRHFAGWVGRWVSGWVGGEGGTCGGLDERRDEQRVPRHRRPPQKLRTAPHPHVPIHPSHSAPSLHPLPPPTPPATLQSPLARSVTLVARTAEGRGAGSGDTRVGAGKVGRGGG
jgi:hypothetical protein